MISPEFVVLSWGGLQLLGAFYIVYLQPVLHRLGGARLSALAEWLTAGCVASAIIAVASPGTFFVRFVILLPVGIWTFAIFPVVCNVFNKPEVRGSPRPVLPWVKALVSVMSRGGIVSPQFIAVVLMMLPMIYLACLRAIQLERSGGS